MPIRFVALSLVMLLTACTHYPKYRYIKPETPEGLACLHKLDAEVSDCETRYKNRADSFQGLYEFQAGNTRQCEHFNDLKMPNACPPPPSPPTRETNYCRDGYATKFVDCGGRIVEIKPEGQ